MKKVKTTIANIKNNRMVKRVVEKESRSTLWEAVW